MILMLCFFLGLAHLIALKVTGASFGWCIGAYVAWLVVGMMAEFRPGRR